MLGAALAEAKQVAWRVASAEVSDVGVRGEASCLASGGGELLVSGGGELLVSGRGKAVGGEIIVAEREREREEKKTERKEKIIKKLIFLYNISGHTVLSLERYCLYMPNVLVFDTPHERGFLVFGVPNAKYLAFSISYGNALICNL